MSSILGIDTSNYTTSVAIYDLDSNEIIHCKRLLPVKENELGLRQSDALFHHINQLPEIIKKAFENKPDIACIGVSGRPRNKEGSYMPCFLAGRTVAISMAAIHSINAYETSHQVGHILASLYSCSSLNLIKDKFIAFHVSGGTTDCLLCEPDGEEVIKCNEIGSSLDLKAGQAIDRVGVMLGLKFPCGIELERLALKADREYKIRAVMKENNCCLSGIENQCRRLLENSEKKENIALFCLQSVQSAIVQMTREAVKSYGDLPIVYAGGVMSNRIIRKTIEAEFSAHFAESSFSCDNAAGTAVYAAIKEGLV